MNMANCTDAHCPVHGEVLPRGRRFTGVVTSDRMSKTATVEWAGRKYLPKYERYIKRRTKVHAHNPECINARKGERVIIAECRPLSKTKHFVVIKTLGVDIKMQLKEELRIAERKKLEGEEYASSKSTDN
ncbi:30S ribosomal protein S17 [Candidatus Woesearchaeota archaeon]|nr:30S ribosomal protein S17 [Candidatus Woesearchaeota archaeon]